jgi:hypothetical protein
MRFANILQTDAEYIIFQAIEICEDAMAEACTYTQERRGWERFNVAYAVTIRSSRGLVGGERKNVSGTGVRGVALPLVGAPYLWARDWVK